MTFKRSEFKSLTRYRRFSSLIRVRSRRNYKLFYTFVWGVFGGGLLCLLLMPWQQTVYGDGRVIAFSPDERRQIISAPLNGMVKRWLVQEGSSVKKGEIIVELTDNDPEILKRLELQRNAKQAKLDAARSALDTSKKNVRRQKALLEKGLSAPLGYEQARLRYNKYLVDEANALSELAKIDVRIARQRNQSVRSPIDGVLLQINAGEGGEVVKQGDSLAILVPSTENRVVELWVDGRDMPLVSKGRHVRLQFEGWPAVQFSGWPMVAVGTFGGEVGFIDAADDGKGFFRLLIFPSADEKWPSSNFLRQGVRAKGWVLLDQVRVGYELWRIFNGFPPALRDFKGEPYGSTSTYTKSSVENKGN